MMIDFLIIIFLIVITVLYFDRLNLKRSEHLTIVSNEGIQNLGKVYNSEKLTTTNLNVTGDAMITGYTTCSNDLTTNGTIIANGNITANGFKLSTDAINITKPLNSTNNLTINGTATINDKLIVTTIVGDDNNGNNGRMHISGNELLYLLNKNGTIVSKAWGGNGNLTVDGSLYAPNALPGAWLINGNNGSMPIFGSVGNLNTYFMGDIDDRWIIMPGYKLTIWKDYYTGATATFDNTTGLRPLMTPECKTIAGYGTNNNTSSCKLYLNGVEIPWL